MGKGDRMDPRRLARDAKRERQKAALGGGDDGGPVKSFGDLRKRLHAEPPQIQFSQSNNETPPNDPPEEIPAEDRMTEEELLKALEGLALPDAAEPGGSTEPEKRTVTDQPAVGKTKREIPHPDAPGISMGKVERDPLRVPPPRRPAARMNHAELERLEEEHALGDPRSTDDIRRRGKKQRQLHRALHERPYAPLASTRAERADEAQNERIGEALEIFSEMIKNGANETIAYQLTGSSLPPGDRSRYDALLKTKYGLDHNGYTFERAPDIGTVAPKDLGSRSGSVDDMPYWRLPGAAVVGVPEAAGGRNRTRIARLQRVIAGGAYQFPSGEYEYDQKRGFVKITDKNEWRARREAVAKARTTIAADAGVQAPERQKEPSSETPPPNDIQDYFPDEPIDAERYFAQTEGDARTRPLDVFEREYTGRQRPLAEAYRTAVRGMSAEEREHFDELLFTTSVPAALLVSVMNDYARELASRRKDLRDAIERSGAVQPAHERGRKQERTRKGGAGRSGPETGEWQPPFGPGWEPAQD